MEFETSLGFTARACLWIKKRTSTQRMTRGYFTRIYWLSLFFVALNFPFLAVFVPLTSPSLRHWPNASFPSPRFSGAQPCLALRRHSARSDGALHLNLCYSTCVYTSWDCVFLFMTTGLPVWSQCSLSEKSAHLFSRLSEREEISGQQHLLSAFSFINFWDT